MVAGSTSEAIGKWFGMNSTTTVAEPASGPQRSAALRHHGQLKTESGVAMPPTLPQTNPGSIGAERSAQPIPRLGLGTWRMGEAAASQRDEVAAVRHAIELGYRLFDTAEMYGEGGAERILGQGIGQALRAREVDRDALCIVSKVYPRHASRAGVGEACRRSLERLGLDYLDLYLLHWRGEHPLADTVEGFQQLCADGLVRRWGVSNFDLSDMQALWSVPGGDCCAVNQVYLSLTEQGACHSLLPWLGERAIIPMAYSPIDQGMLAQRSELRAIARRHAASAAQIALAWLLTLPGVVAIPKAVQSDHLASNFAAQRLRLTPEDRAELSRLFPPPARKTPLAVI